MSFFLDKISSSLAIFKFPIFKVKLASLHAHAFKFPLAPIIFFAKIKLHAPIFFTGFLFHESWSYAIQFFVLGGIFFAQALFIFSSCSILAYRMGKKLKLLKHSDIWDKVQALILFVIALILIYP